jgi:DNA-binding transcriptional LysR family regulator
MGVSCARVVPADSATIDAELAELAELAALAAWRDKPAGTVRISTHNHAITTVLWPRLLPLLHAYPDIQVEFAVDYAMTDIVAEHL